MRRLVIWVWQGEFARRLARAAGIPMSRSTLRAEIARLPQADMPGQDAASRFNRALAQNLHAAVVHLERNAGLPSQDAVKTARIAFVATGSWLARGAVRLWLRLERDPFAGIAKRGSTKLAQALWGEGMVLEERTAPGEISLCVRSCPFHTYFWNAGRSDVTPILCAWDTAWVDEIGTVRRPIAVEVRGTLAAGDERCEFTFLDGNAARDR